MRLPQIGELFENRYRIERILGEGGFGTVYAATDISASRPVALKVLKPDSERGYDPDTRSRFDRESRIVGSLTNPHTVSMFDRGTSADGSLFMVFERVGGVDLSELLARSGRLEPATVVHIVRQVLESLREAHDAGLLHRDLKPENIRVFEYAGDPFTVKLLDFGLARHSDSSHPSITKTGELIGTPRYMSPEQITDGELTAASDLYSLGLVALECLLGRDALHGNRWGDQLDRLAHDHTFDIATHDVIGVELTKILSRMTAREPRRRFGSAAAVLAALDAVGKGRARASSGSSASLSVPATPRWPLVVLAIGIAAALIAAVRWVRTPEGVTPAPQIVPRRTNAIVSKPSAVRPVTTDGADSGTVDTGKADDAIDPTRLSGCGKEPPFTGLGRLRDPLVMVGESWPTYIPKTYDATKPAPVILLLHASGESGARMIAYSGFIDVAEREGLILIAPTNSRQRPWEQPSDVVALREAVNAAAERLCVDESRVFGAGQASGGRLAAGLACTSWIAGIAVNSFRTLRGEALCNTAVRTPLIAFSGMKDRVDRPEGGAGDCSTSIKDSVDDFERKWRAQNGCDGPGKNIEQVNDSGCIRWSCETPFVSCRLDGGHGWSGSPNRGGWLGACDNSLPPKYPMAEVIWRFFSKLPAR